MAAPATLRSHIEAQVSWGLYWHAQRTSGRWPMFSGAYAHNQHMSAMHVLACEATLGA